MRTIIIISSYIVALFLLLFGGLLIGGNCSYSNTGGPMNIDYSVIFALFGLISIFVSFLLMKKLIKKNKVLFGTIIILYALGLFCLGQYAMYDSKKDYDNLETMIDVLPPKSGILGIYYLTSFFAFMYGLILIFDKFCKTNE